jgi:hypothetical protein
MYALTSNETGIETIPAALVAVTTMFVGSTYFPASMPMTNSLLVDEITFAPPGKTYDH